MGLDAILEGIREWNASVDRPTPAESNADRPTTRPPAISVDERPYVLVVEDDSDAREVIRDILEANGYRVKTAGHGVEALGILDEDYRAYFIAFAREQQLPPFPVPCCILLDVMMPLMDGMELFALLRAGARPQYKGARIIAMSANASITKMQAWALDITGINDVDGLEKPFTSTDLLTKVDAACHAEVWP